LAETLSNFAAAVTGSGWPKAGELDVKKGREQLDRLQQSRVKTIEQVVRTVRRGDVPDLENGAAIRRSHLDTVNNYRTVETRQLAEFRRLATVPADQFQVAV
jgi:hypothetical protein